MRANTTDRWESKRRLHKLALLACAAAVMPSAAYAAAASDAAPSASTTRSVEEVVVTGQKRLGTTKDIPVTVNVVSPETLRAAQVHDIQGLTQVISGFSYEKAPGLNLTGSIRGIGTAPGATSLEQSIAPYVNGVYQAGTQRGFAWPVFDMERVEVFKGTQQGIVGQNTSVGVINMVTQKPGREPGGFIDASGEFVNRGYALSGAVDVPVSDKFRVRFSGLQQEVGGWAHNFGTGHDIPESYFQAARANAVWELSDKVTVDLYGEYDRIKSKGPIVSQVFDDPTGGYAKAIAPFFNWSPSSPDVAYTDRRGRASGDDLVDADNLRGSATVNWDLGGGYSFTSVTAASREHDFLSVDQDFTPAPSPPPTPTSQVSQALAQRYHYKQFTEELRLASPSGDRFSYILGAWYRHAHTNRLFQFFRDRFGANDVANEPYDQTIDNAAVFGDAQFAVTSNFTIGGSLRYTTETKTAVLSGVSNWPVVFLSYPQTTVSLKPSFLDGSVRAEYKPSSALSLYAAYAHGTKTGAVPDIVGSGIIQVLRPEKAGTFEVGAKGVLFDHAVSYEVSAFRMNITDFQDVSTQVVNGLTVFFASNSNVRTNGADFSVRVRPVRGLELGVNGEYLDAFNKTFNGPHVRSPKWSAIWDARYTLEPKIAGGEVSLFGSVQYKGSYFTQPANVTTVFGPQAIKTVIATQSPSFTKLNVGVEYALARGIKVDLICRNCTNEYEYTRVVTGVMFGAPVRYGYLNELRTITLDVRYDF